MAALKPCGRFLELGTGTGMATAWLLAGMSDDATLDSVDNDPNVQSVARRHLENDPRVTFHLTDAAEYLARPPQKKFDFVFADTWAGKYSHLNLALTLIDVGGIYFIDDLLPQPSWPEGHGEKVPVLVADLKNRPDFCSARFDCASGLMMSVRTRAS